MVDFPDDEEEYEEVNGGNQLLGFMFGNVDNAGDLDVDYLDEVIFCFLFHALFLILHVNKMMMTPCPL